MAQSEDERRESKRVWAASKRAAARAERDARLREARVDALANASRTQRDALEVSIAAARWLKDSDGASVNLARILAREFDYADHMGEDVTALRVAGQLIGIMDKLGLTPTSRIRFELRSASLQAIAEASSDETVPTPALPANVSKLKRPAKRGDGDRRG